MKKSNIIAIAIGAFIVISILIFYIDGKKHKNSHLETVFETVQLPNFSVIVAEEGADVHIIQSDTIQLKIEKLKNNAKNSTVYSIANDTLRVYKGNNVFVYNNNTIAVIAKNSRWVGVEFSKIDTLNLHLNNCKEFVLNNNAKECIVEKLNLSAINSNKIYVNDGISIKSAVLKLKKSELNIWDGNYKNVSVTLSDNSSLQINQGELVKNLSLTKDSTSHFNIYN